MSLLRIFEAMCCKAGVAETTFYNWRKRYGGLTSSEVKRLRRLDDVVWKTLKESARRAGEARQVASGASAPP